MTSLVRRISSQRENLILAQARPYLSDGEVVLKWVRGRRTDGRGEGFVFLTRDRCVVHWTGRSDGPGTFPWTEIKGWGVVPDAKGGPILGIETDDGTCTVQLRATTPAMAARVADFIQEFADHAPFGREPMKLSHGHASFEALAAVDVSPHRMSTAEKVQRAAITIGGATMVVGGIVLTPLPGPWSLPIVIAGLALLAREYDWAKDAREWMRAKSRVVADKLKGRKSST